MVTSVVLESQVKIIQQLVRNNPRFLGNEDLFEEFTNEAYSKLHVFINSIKDLTKIEGYAAKIVNTSILTILKKQKRLKNTSANISQTKTPLNISDINEILEKSGLDYEDKIMYELLDPKFSYSNTKENKELINSILNSVMEINKEYPNEQYLKLYKLRYINKKTQNQISFELNIAQNEVAERLFKLNYLVKSYIN